MPNTKGQTLLVVVLVISVSLIVAMSAVSRSVTDVAISGKEVESQRAFSAAEAGIEQALVTSNGYSGSVGDATVVTEYAALEGREVFDLPGVYASGDVATVWLVSHDSNGNPHWVCDPVNYPCYNGGAGGNMRVCWNGDIAIEATVYYTTGPGDGSIANMKITRAGYDVVNSRGNNFANVGEGKCDHGTLSHKQMVSLPNGSKFVQFRPLYNTTPTALAVDGTGVGAFPLQGRLITSRGTSGEATRKINVFQGYNEIPAIFDAGLYSSGSITK